MPRTTAPTPTIHTPTLTPLDQLRPHPRNYRHHPDDEIAHLRASLRDHGVYHNVVAAQDGTLLAGHGVVAAALAERLTDILVVHLPIDPDDPRALKVLAADNLVSRLARDDPRAIADLLADIQELDDLLGTGYDVDDLPGLDALASGDPGDLDPEPDNQIHGDPDEIPEPEHTPTVTQFGDVWLLGRHRVMCGSSTDASHLATLMAGALADAMITDPPYGVDYGDTVEFRRTLGKSQRPTDDSHVTNDGLAEALALWDAVFPLAASHMGPRAAFYCWSPPGDQQIDLGVALRAAGFDTHGTIIWVKSSFSFSRADHKYQHEPAFYGWPAKAVHDWHGPNNETTVWEYDRPRRSELHPTQKPVELIERCVRNITQAGDIVLDPFLGSGTTLIAAHTGSATCYGMELAPRYVDVICARWQAATGIAPVLERTGEAHDFTPTP